MSTPLVYSQAYTLNAGALAAFEQSMKLARIGIDNALERATLTATTTAEAKSVASLVTRDTYQNWRPTAVPATVTATFDSAEAIDYVGVAAHNLGTVGGALTVQAYSETAESWYTVASWSPTTDAPLLAIFAPIEATEVRFLFTGGTVPTVGVAFVGLATVMQRQIHRNAQPVFLSAKTDIKPQISDGGKLLGSMVIRRGVELSPSWRNLTKAFYNATLRPLALRMPTDPFFFAWNPDYAPEEVAYGQVTGDPDGDHQGGATSLYSFGFSMVGVGSR